VSERGLFSRLLRDVFNAGSAARDVITSRVPRAPLGLVLYDGFGVRDRILVHGRALRDEGLGTPNPDDPRWRNLIATVRRADADPISHAAVRVHAGLSAHDFVSDDEGFFHGWMTASGLPAPDDWAPLTAELLTPAPEPGTIRAQARVLFPATDPGLLIISDIDDTVLQSRATNLFAALRMVLLENAHTRLPFPGVAAFYRALRAGASGTARNPTFYVSSSPWNLYDVITRFLELQEIPHGPLMLRDVDLNLDALSGRGHHAHKREMIRRVLHTYPTSPAVLIGDSGQQDPEIYRDVVHEFKGRIRAVYIRDVSGHPERSRVIQQLAEEVLQAGSTLLLTPDTLAAASHAVELGLVNANALAEIGAEKRSDSPT
jgi:phosphatidate phosphatase APP1